MYRTNTEIYREFSWTPNPDAWQATGLAARDVLWNA